MTRKVFTAKYNYSMPTEEFKKISSSVATKFLKIPGLHWKIWLMNEDRKEAGGVYLFESARDLEEFLNSHLFAALRENPAFSNLQINTFDVAEATTVITGARLMSSLVDY